MHHTKLIATLVIAGLTGNLPAHTMTDNLPAHTRADNFTAQPLTEYVRPMVGTSNFGATNPGAVCPSGMMSVSPFNVTGSALNTWDKDARWWSTPYSSDNVFFTDYSHVNLSGVGCPELGTVLTMPTSGTLIVDNRLYGSEYADETASPGYYSNRLLQYDILTEVTATLRSSIERYTFHKGRGNIIVNLGQGLTNESGAFIRRISDTEIEGMRLCGSFCYNPQAVFPQYFFIRVVHDGEMTSGFWKKQPAMTAEAQWDIHADKYKIYTIYDREIAGDDIGAWFSFDASEGEQVLVQVGVSFVSAENARLNLEAEQPAADFDKVLANAQSAWEREVFYTALYHTLLHPNVVSHALEYYVADNALSLLAGQLAKERPDKAAQYRYDAKRFRKRSSGWRNCYSPDSGTLRPRLSDGSFLTPFNPADGADFSNAPGFHEGSAWNYSFYIPHDVEGLVKAMGGRKSFISKLQKVFDEKLYDPANEPDIAYPYLFSRFKGEEKRTAQTVAAILERYYTTRPDGIPGNDDTGTMSAWAVFSMMGLYPDCPGEPFYTLTTPVFDTVEIDSRILIRKDTPIKKYRITHEELSSQYGKK